MKYLEGILRLVRCGKLLIASVSLSLFVTACSPTASSPEEVTEFKEAGAIQAAVDFDQLIKGRSGPYRVVPGDVLEFQMHVDLRVVSSELADWLRPSYGRRDLEPYLVRVSDEGNITLPIIGDLQVQGQTLAEIEEEAKSAYFPKYVVNPPMLFCQVKQYQTEHERVFTVMGLVLKPDAYPYPADVQYNLMQALAFAGGFDMVADPRYVKVFRQDTDGEVVQAIFGIGDEEGLKNAYEVAVKPGDVVYVDHTFRTRVNKFMADMFHITVGAVHRSDY